MGDVMEWMLAPYKRYAEFSGRSRRMEYWMFRLFEFGAIIGLFLISAIVAGAASSVGGDSAGGIVGGIASLLIMVLILGSIIPSLAVTVRRLHDTGRSGWYMFISLIPLIGAIMLLIALFSEGTRGGNEYGSDPKGGDLPDEVFA